LRPLALGIPLILLVFLSRAGTLASRQPYHPNATGPSQTGQQQTKPAQEPAQKPQQPAQKPDETIHLSSRLVLVPVSASDSSGQPVKDLTSADITIEEDGKPQQVISLGAPGKTPIDIGLLLDVSGSTQKQFAFEQQAAVRFIGDLLKTNDAVSVFSIGAAPKLVRARTANRDEAVAGLMSIMPSSDPTAFFDSVFEAAVYLERNGDPGSRRVLVVISDGEENFSKYSTLDAALKELQKTDCLFYSINPSGGGIKLNKISQRGQAFMEALASQTGGQAFNVSRVEELEPVFGKIAEELQAQYLFGYYAPDESANGGFRKIAVRAPKRPDLRIRARQGYYLGKN
jgi:Ca-activated chloride channel family protein